MLTDERIAEIRDRCMLPQGERIYAFARAIEAEVKAESEPVAWETTGYGLVKYVTDSRYRKFSRTIQAYYKPYKCSSCTTPQPCKKCAQMRNELREIDATLDNPQVNLLISSVDAIKELQAKVAELDQSLGSIVMSLWATNYRDVSPNFELLGDASGKLSQLDNMCAGLRAQVASLTQDRDRANALAEVDRIRLGLQNCRLFAARHRKEDWALLILGFCAEAGEVGSITR